MDNLRQSVEYLEALLHPSAQWVRGHNANGVATLTRTGEAQGIKPWSVCLTAEARVQYRSSVYSGELACIKLETAWAEAQAWALVLHQPDPLISTSAPTEWRPQKVLKQAYHEVAQRWYDQRAGALQLLAASALRDEDLQALADAGVIETGDASTWAASIRGQLQQPACYARLVAVLRRAGFLTNTNPGYALSTFEGGPVASKIAWGVCYSLEQLLNEVSRELNNLGDPNNVLATCTTMYERLDKLEERAIDRMLADGYTREDAEWAWFVHGGHALAMLIHQIRRFKAMAPKQRR